MVPGSTSSTRKVPFGPLARLRPRDGAISAFRASDAVPRVLNEKQGASLKLGGTLSEHRGKMLIHRIGSFVGQSEDDDARFVQDSEGEHVAEIDVERQNDAGIRASALSALEVRGSCSPNVRT